MESGWDAAEAECLDEPVIDHSVDDFPSAVVVDPDRLSANCEGELDRVITPGVAFQQNNDLVDIHPVSGRQQIIG